MHQLAEAFIFHMVCNLLLTIQGQLTGFMHNSYMYCFRAYSNIDVIQ